MAISKKIRFEVFKRDGFRCGYCGKTPPEVTLEVDHINPKKLDGSDEIENLITACFDCNRGKKHIPLEKLPNSIQDNVEILQEKQLQLKEYNKILVHIELQKQKDIQKIDAVYQAAFSGYQLSEEFKNSTLKLFLSLLPLQQILDAMSITVGRVNYPTAAIKYFCGVCWRKIKGENSYGNKS